MDSYNFSSDSTSSFFVKETTSDDNVVEMENITGSILQLNSSDELQRVDHIDHMDNQGSVKIEPSDLDGTMNSNEVFVITIDGKSILNGGKENPCNDNTIEFQSIEPESVKSEVGMIESASEDLIQGNDKEHLSENDIEMVLTLPDDSSKVDNVINESDNNINNDEAFDMEQFLSPKVSKQTLELNASAKIDKNSSSITKHFTECGPNSVMCNLCSDVLLSNQSNLLLHLRHVHKNDRNEANNMSAWNYFTKIDAFKARCNLCSISFIYRNRMSTLYKHLRVTHKKHTDNDMQTANAASTPEMTNTDIDKKTGGSPSDVIVIQNSDGKLINQIKVNKSWKCFTKLPNSDKMICNLCTKIFIHNKTNDLLQHLHEEHKNLLGVKQDAIQQSINDIESTTDTENGGEKLLYDTDVGTPKSVIVQKVSTHANRFGKGWRSKKIWEYFTLLDEIDKIKCTLCDKLLSKSYSTSNLLRHLNAKHPDAYSAIEEISNSDTDSIKIVIQNEKGQQEKGVSVADMLEDYENMLNPNKKITVDESKTNSKVKQPVSETWKHFTKLKGSTKVKCKICRVTLSYTEGVSSNLTRHLRLKHKTESGKDQYITDIKSGEISNNAHDTKSDITCALKKGNTNSASDSFKAESINDPSNTDASTTVGFSVGESEATPNSSSTKESKLYSVGVDNLNDEDKLDNCKLRSKAWDYFTKMVPENKVVCNLCSHDVPYTKGSTYKLFRHLSFKHGITFKKSPKPRKVFAYNSDTSDEDLDGNNQKKSDTMANDSTFNTLQASTDDTASHANPVEVKREAKVTGRTWKHFTKLDRDKAKCNLCSKVLSYKLGQTFNLIKHIQLQHKNADGKRNDVTPEPSENKIKDKDNSVKKVQKPKPSENKIKDKDDSVKKGQSPPVLFKNDPNFVWRYFTKLEESKALCNLCEYTNIISHHKNSRSNLIRHLNRKHKYIIKSDDDDSFTPLPETCENDNEVSRLADHDIKDDLSLEGAVESDSDILDMESLFIYLITDEKLKKCIKFENNQIKCRLCSGSFVCNNLINYEYTIRYHVQIFHAEWTVMCFDDTLIKRECITPDSDPDVSNESDTSDVLGSNYNELEAIANEVSSFLDTKKQPIGRIDNSFQKPVVNRSATKTSVKDTLSDDIWKYFTKLTSQNVRCNFCSILLSFRQHKKWNLIRHLKLKHRSKVNMSALSKKANLKALKNKMSLPSNAKSGISTRSKKYKSVNSMKKVSTIVSPVKKIKIDPEFADNMEDKKNKTKKIVSNAAKKSGRSTPKLRKSKPKKEDEEEESNEKKPVPISSFNSPINRRIGRTWSHFTKIEMGKAQCNICNGVLLYRGNGVDLLNDHLTGKHSNYFDGSSSEPQKSFTKKTNFDVQDSESSEESDSEDNEEKNISNKPDKTPKRKIASKKDVDKKDTNRVWQYFTKTKSGFASCQLCLSEISYNASTVGLIHHLQKIHSVISLLTPTKDSEVPKENETEQSKLLAAVDLTPIKSQDKRHLCYTRLNKNVVRCNFCPRVLYHKSGNMHKLMSHIFYKHRQEAAKYKSLKNMKFYDNGKEIVLKVNEKHEKQPVTDTLPVPENKVDKRKIYRSNTWLYFTKLNDHYAKCNVCLNAFSYKGGSIYNLNRHLFIKHDVKLIKRFEMSQKKLETVSVPTPNPIAISKKRSETLLFYKRINRFTVRCKLCMKRFVHKGANMNRLVAHLWSSHITKIIDTGGLNRPEVVSNAEDEDINKESTTKDDVKGVDVDVTCNEDPSKESFNASKKLSSTWNYFTHLNDDGQKNVMCNICEKKFCFKNAGNLSNLSRHLENKHNIKKDYDCSTLQSRGAGDNGNVEDMTGSEKKKLQRIKVDGSSDSAANIEAQTKVDESEVYVFFLKINNSDDDVQCKFCNVVLKRDNLDELRDHLSSKHDINDFLLPKDVDKQDAKSDIQLPFQRVGRKSVTFNENSRISKMKCKLCYKEFVFRGNNILSNLGEHLKIVHELELRNNEKQLLMENKIIDDPTKNTEDACNNTNEKIIKGNLYTKNMVLSYFKNLKLDKNKCTVCYKFISSKRPCYHRITNDLTLRYSVQKVKRKYKSELPNKNIEDDVDSKKTDSVSNDNCSKVLSQKRFSNGRTKIKHYMSVNVFDNKCYDCMASRNGGYCVHSINLWIMNENKRKAENVELNTAYNNQVALNSDEVQLITDSLNGCNDNNIIIITDNDDTPILNYDLTTNKSESGTQDISYHIVNSINDIDDDDIKVIIYNYNTEGGVNVEGNSGVKITEIVENAEPSQDKTSPHKELEEQINNSVNELPASPELEYNNEIVEDNEDPLKEKEVEVSSETEAVENFEQQTDKDPSVDNSETLSDGTQEIKSEGKLGKTYDLEKLTELAEVSCNEQFYKQNPSLIYPEHTVEVDVQSETETINAQQKSSGGSDRCIVETIYPDTVAVEGGLAIEKEYVMRNVVYNTDDVETCTVPISPLKDVQDDFVPSDCPLNNETEDLPEVEALPESEAQSESEAQPKSEAQPEAEVMEQAEVNVDGNNKNNEVISEDVINAIFNEVIVNLQENPDDKELDLIKLNNDNIEIPSGLYLQNMKSLFKLNKIIVHYSNINYKYKTARCNLCKLCLQFVEPVIYNLLMHLFTHHKDKLCTDEAINKNLMDGISALDHANRPRRKSPVWKYFINAKNFRATCKICRFSFSYKGGAINNLSRHLRLRHNIISAKSSDGTDCDVDYMVSYPKRRATVKLRSKTWTYFSKEPNDWAKCKICKKYLSYRSSTINNLTRHLRTIHSKIFDSLFMESDKEPIFIKNEDGTLTENANFIHNDPNNESCNSLLVETSNKSRDEILQECSYSSIESNNRRKSIVWNYFTELTTNCGRCNFCSKVISCKGGGTSNLSRHLRSRHGIWIVLTSNLSQSFSDSINDPALNLNLGDSSNPTGGDVNDTIITQEQLHILKNRKVIHKKSKTWEYFTKEGPDRVRCNLCSKPLSYKCKAVHNLRRHLSKKHPSCIVKPDPVRLKLQINTENDVLHNSNETSNPLMNDCDKKFIDITDTSVVIVDEESQLPPHRPDRNSRPKKSIVWNYFEELEYGIAKCLICSKILSFRGGGTNNLMRHLRCRHAIIIINQSSVVLDEADDKKLVLTDSHDKVIIESNEIPDEQIAKTVEVTELVLNDPENVQSN